jgi:hypothetical protein
VEVIEDKPQGKLVEMALLARVQTGPKIKVGEDMVRRPPQDA